MEMGQQSFQTSRGAVLLIGSQLVAIIVGFAIHFGLTRLLEPEVYGLYAVAISILMWGELLVSGSIGTVFPKLLSEGTSSAKTLWSWVWRGYLPLWLALWLTFSAASWGIAIALRDGRLVPLILIAALELPFFGIYFAGRSLLQGLMAHGWQAVVASSWALFRLFFIFAFVIFTGSVFWAMAGNSLGVAMTALLSVALVRPFLRDDKSTETVSLPSLLVGIGSITLLIALLDQIALTMDLWLLKRLSQPEFSGHYGAARFFALVPLMLAFGLYSAWFPAMCHELGKGERGRAKALLKEVMRVLIVGLLPFAVIVWVTAKPLTVLLFSQKFVLAAEPLRLLAIGASLFVLMGFMRGALIADNEFKLPVVIAAIMTALDFALCYTLIPHYGMVGGAMATMLTGGFGTVVTGFLAFRRFGAFLPMGTLVRVTVASLAIGAIAVLWKTSGLMLPLQYLLLAAIYTGLLVFLGELTSSDWQVLRIVFAGIWGSMVARKA
jgi:O-antigen/teichoic acid export membrane protein